MKEREFQLRLSKGQKKKKRQKKTEKNKKEKRNNQCAEVLLVNVLNIHL